jgi:hypothetical protein
MPSSERVSSRCPQPQLLAQALRALREVGLVAPAAHHLAQLGAVGRQHRGAGVARPVVALGVDDGRAARLVRRGDHRVDVRERPLAVVGQHEHGVARDLGAHRRELGLERGRAGRLLEVDPHQLLLARDHAQLDDGGELGLVRQPRRDAGFGGQRLDAAAGLVLADHADQGRARSQRREVARDVGGAAPAARRCGPRAAPGTGASGEMRWTSPNQ